MKSANKGQALIARLTEEAKAEARRLKVDEHAYIMAYLDGFRAALIDEVRKEQKR